MNQKPIVYSCSGCSSAAQLANELAVKLDRAGVADMSCIVGVGGDVKPLLKVAHSGRPIVALDGCKLHCVRHVLAKQNLVPALHIDLSERAVQKRLHTDFDPQQANQILSELTPLVAQLATAIEATATRKTGSTHA